MKQLLDKFRRVRRDANRLGWVQSIWLRVASRLGNFLGVTIAQIRGRRLDTDVPPIESSSNIDFQELDATQILAYPGLDEIDLDVSFVHEAARLGHRIFCALAGNRIVGYTVRGLGGGPHIDGIWVWTNDEIVYAYKAFVHPDYRGQRIAPALTLLADEAFKKAGCRTRVGFVAVSNVPSLRVGRHVGSEVFGYAGYLKWGRIFLPFRTAGVRPTGFRFVMEERS